MKTIPLSQGLIATVDDEAYEAVAAFKWSAMKQRNTFYAVRGILTPEGERTTGYLHRFIWELLNGPIPDDMTIDHRDRDGLNNAGANLRLATHQQQNLNKGKQANNSSGFVGVSYRNDCGKWRTCVMADGRTKSLGHFDCPVNAAMAYDRYMYENHGGEFTGFNFL